MPNRHINNYILYDKYLPPKPAFDEWERVALHPLIALQWWKSFASFHLRNAFVGTKYIACKLLTDRLLKQLPINTRVKYHLTRLSLIIISYKILWYRNFARQNTAKLLKLCQTGILNNYMVYKNICRRKLRLTALNYREKDFIAFLLCKVFR